MTSFQIAKEHFAKSDRSILVQVRGKDYILYKSYFSSWEFTQEDIEQGREVISDRIPLYIVNPTRREKLGYRWVSAKNITIKKENTKND